MEEKLLHIFYQDAIDEPTIQEYIATVDRLNELVAVEQTDSTMPGVSNALYVNENRIHILPDWLDQRPAIVFPSEIPFNKHTFLGAIFGMLGNEEKYREYLTGLSPLVFAFDLIQAIVKAEEADKAMEAILRRTNFAHPFENYTFNHNVAIGLNYGRFSGEIIPEAIEAHYKDALQLAFEPSYKALTLKYYATFLMDNSNSKAATRLLDEQSFKTLEDYAKYSLDRVWCQAAMKQLSFPYDENKMAGLKERLWNTLQFFDKNGHKSVAAFLWMDAATIANLNNSYSESLGYITKAISYFKQEGQLEMAAQAQLVQGRILYDWAQSGSPQFYRNALESYQQALKVFKQDNVPVVFADIQHQLGVIYAELPDDEKVRSIWSAMSAASFNEALKYYTKTDFPYEYGMICNNYGNAYTKYPQGGLADNFEKALGYYEEALSVRPALEYPRERAVTLLNYLEASWKVGNPEEGFNSERFNGMVAKVNEIKALTNDKQLLTEGIKHLELLEKLSKEMTAAV